MSIKSCNRINNGRVLLVAAFVLLVSALAWASKKDDKFKAAQAAATAGRIDEATRLYCEVAEEDPAYRNGEAKQNCSIMTQEAAKEAKRNEERFADGVKLFNSGDYDGAEQKFKNVKSGPHLAEAGNYLLAKIPAARQAAKAAGDEVAMSARFDQAMQAYQSNNFSSARSLLAQITGKRQGDAQTYLKKIQQFEQALQEGDNLAANKNYKAAIASYTDAANIKGDGPGDPRGKIGQMQTLMASLNNLPVNNNTSGTSERQPVNPNPATRQVVAAVVQPTRPKIDAEKLMRDAQTEQKRGNTGAARGKYLAVLAEDPKNGKARLALASLPKETGASQQKAGEEADIMLAKGISDFYTGQYEDAEVHIKDYIEVNGGKTALGYFYRGVSKLTRYYLGGEQPNDRRLLADAQNDFRAAKKTPGFNPPEKFVSPKIIRVYRELPGS